MPDPTDVVLPILRRIQADLAETRQDVARNTKTLASHGESLERIEGYLTYELGLTARARADIQSPQAEMKAIKKRLAALERPPTKGGPKTK